MNINSDAFYEDELDSSLDYCVSQSTVFGDYDKILFIENEEDERFWKYIFKQLDPNIKLDFHSYFRRKKEQKDSESSAQGKQQVLKFRDIVEDYSGVVFLCIDSDFDYILDNFNINSNPYILQTYVYSVENFICCAKSLNELCSDLLFPEGTFDFVLFYKNFSKNIRELFIYHILLKSHSRSEDDKIKAVYKSIISNISGIKTLSDLSKLYTSDSFLSNIEKELERIKDNYPKIIEDFKRISKKIDEDEKIINDMLYLYINGHLVYDLTCTILKKISNLVLSNKIKEVKVFLSGTQLKNKIQELKNKNKDISSVLDIRYNYCFQENLCPNFQNIIDDLIDAQGISKNQ